MLKIKTFSALTETKLDDKVNQFIQNERIDVREIKFSATLITLNAAVIYTD
jgi:hypothetical protein